MRKSDIGKLFNFKFPKRKDEILGVVLDFNEQWVIVKRFYDYSLDGFTIFRNNQLEYSHGEYERFATRILKLKNFSNHKEPRIPIDSLESLFSYIDKKHKLIQLDTKDGTAFDVVRYTGMKASLFLFKELTTRAKWRYKLELSEKYINYISFDNDYLNSLKLVTKF